MAACVAESALPVGADGAAEPAAVSDEVAVEPAPFESPAPPPHADNISNPTLRPATATPPKILGRRRGVVELRICCSPRLDLFLSLARWYSLRPQPKINEEHQPRPRQQRLWVALCPLAWRLPAPTAYSIGTLEPDRPRQSDTQLRCWPTAAGAPLIGAQPNPRLESSAGGTRHRDPLRAQPPLSPPPGADLPVDQRQRPANRPVES